MSAQPTPLLRLGDSLPAVLLRYALAWRPRFGGRATRRELGLTALGCIAALVVLTMLTPAPPPDVPGRAPRDGIYALQVLYGTILAGLPLLAAMVRRMQDCGRDGWGLLMVLIPYLGLLYIAYFMLDGPTPGPNQFGEDPRGRR